ncbi:hypothetical protein DH2020_013742 [Rehmannia glutinosa]|uniref:Uncharacterized protein n=1 Tax=Rehmannia glutinosa TaxID=99300 RepID=A0ABR0X348_REHGL
MVYRSFFFAPLRSPPSGAISLHTSGDAPHSSSLQPASGAAAQSLSLRTLTKSLESYASRFNLPLPEGYYGNALALPVAISTAEKLSKNSLHYAVELIRKTKSKVTEEYVKSVADLMVIRGRPNLAVARTYLVSSLMHMGFEEVDFGWGKPVYGGGESRQYCHS